VCLFLGSHGKEAPQHGVLIAGLRAKVPYGQLKIGQKAEGCLIKIISKENHFQSPPKNLIFIMKSKHNAIQK
jgi:hypothetical protein